MGGCGGGGGEEDEEDEVKMKTRRTMMRKTVGLDLAQAGSLGVEVVSGAEMGILAAVKL